MATDKSLKRRLEKIEKRLSKMKTRPTSLHHAPSRSSFRRTGQRGRVKAFMSRETTLSGGPMGFSHFMNRLFGHLFRLRSDGIETQGEAPSAREVSGSLAALFRETGHEPPEDLSVQTKGEACEGASRVHVTLTPHATLLKGGGGRWRSIWPGRGGGSLIERSVPPAVADRGAWEDHEAPSTNSPSSVRSTFRFSRCLS